MARIISFGKVDSLTKTGEILMPLVVVKVCDEKTTYNGFIPGITTNDIVCNSLETCKTELKKLAKKIVSVMGKENTEFPFFPTKQEILHDFKNVVYISFIKIKSNKRKEGI